MRPMALKRKQQRAPKNPVASALAQLRWAKASQADRKAVGKQLADARRAKRKGGK